jgi:hypothetical protein
MLEVTDIPEVGIQVSHNGNDGAGGLVPFFPVLDPDSVFDHFLNIPSVFRQDQFGSLGVIIVFHSKLFIAKEQKSSGISK